MKDKFKKDIIFLCSVAGHLMKSERLDWGNVYLKLQKDKLLDEVLRTTDLIKALINEKEFEKLHKNVKDGLYYCDVFTDIEFREHQKKSLSTKRKVDGESIFDLAEFAIGNNCKECNKNKKACRLRKSLLKAGIPAHIKKYGVCEYLQNEGEDKIDE